MANDLSDVNARFTLSIPDVFATPQVLQQYATDDAWASDEVDIAETMIGVDGIMSAGYTPFIIQQTVFFQATSPSILAVMEQWRSAMTASQQTLWAQGIILVPSIGTQYQLYNGVLVRVTPFPRAKKVLQPVTYRIHWNGYNASPMV